MLLNYHELTMEESSDSPARKSQFRIICLVIIVTITYSIISTGALRPVEIMEDGIFPGGEYIYKYTGRDYAASMSLLDHIATTDLKIKQHQYNNTLYNLYLDDPLLINGRRQRFASGILLNENTIITSNSKQQQQQSQYQTTEECKTLLLETINNDIDKKIAEDKLTKKEINELSAFELWKILKYHKQILPKTSAAIAIYPSTNGFVSALLHSYKVFPTIRKFVQEKYNLSKDIVLPIITTCNLHESTCTHYVPYTDIETFRLGQPQQTGTIGEGVVNWDGVKNMILKIVTLGQKGGKEDNVVADDDDDDDDHDSSLSSSSTMTDNVMEKKMEKEKEMEIEKENIKDENENENENEDEQEKEEKENGNEMEKEHENGTENQMESEKESEGMEKEDTKDEL